jgi:16S rRNA C1402 (ribose-2'-O) methylase RsmI
MFRQFFIFATCLVVIAVAASQRQQQQQQQQQQHKQQQCCISDCGCCLVSDPGKIYKKIKEICS